MSAVFRLAHATNLTFLALVSPVFTACAAAAAATPAASAVETPVPAAVAPPVVERPIDVGAAPADVAAPPPDAARTASGVASKVLTRGTETTHPGVNDEVTVRYSGWTTEGKRILPLGAVTQGVTTFPLRSQLNVGWTEGVQLMVVGEKRRLWVPQELAHELVPQGMLVYDLELLAIKTGPPPPPDVASPPSDAKKTLDGLATRVTKPGTGNVHPQPADGVRVLYTLWARDGRLLLMADKPRLHGVMSMYEGWSTTLQQMVEGEARTVWVPESLGWFHRDVTLVVELVEVVPAPPTPADVRAAPRDAVMDKSGLVSKVVKRGTGTVHPTANSQVAAQYVSWTPKGTVVDSSYGQGPVELRLASISPRFAEALELMVEGEARRIWTPEALVRGSITAAGPLVYDVELVRVGPPARPR